MKKVAIVGLGWLGMPLAMSLSARGWQVTGSKTTQDGVEAARMSGIDSYLLRMEPELVCDSDELDALMDVDALVITLPARRSGPGDEFYLQAVQELVDSALAHRIPRIIQAVQELVDSALAHRIPRIIFTSSTSVYGDAQGTVKETTPRNPVTNSGRVLEELEDWLHNLPGTSVDILRLAGLVGPGRHPGRFFAGKNAPDGEHGVNLVHLEDVIGAITLLLQAPKGGHIYNICAPAHPARNVFYPQMARLLGLEPPQFRNSLDSGKGKIIDGSRICNELGFEYQYPDPLVMPLE
ncbi:NAD dependent epimerase/dehydratase family protein [Escherichia coli AI27]|nr:SDR family oxidoreductase [Escherichia coli]EIE55246.1 NAD dependent epimerase/dehydratase family protein [Escherichia coli AI27]